tara:strand:- start:338 stop:496 length:159 start_codon:yes stop_codon:yes gene_type:complete
MRVLGATSQELLEDGMWMQPNEMGEHPNLDPFLDDAPIECSIDEVDICESCQ